MNLSLLLAVALAAPCGNETATLQARIDEAAAAGGGEVRVAAGEHRIGGLVLKSGVTLRLERCARLIASRDPADYENRVDDDGAKSPEAGMYRANRWENAIIRMYGATDVSIVGELGSVIDGGNCADPNGEEHYRGPHGISAIGCTNVTLRGYTLVHSGNWAHRILKTEGIAVSGVTVLGGHDGFHVRQSRNVRVSDCLFDTGDDAVAGFDNCDMVVSNCVLKSACSPVRLGGRDVLIVDCTADGGSYPHRWTLSDVRKARGEEAAPGEGRRNMGCFFQYFTNDRVSYRWTPDNMVFRNIVVRNADLFACSLTGLGLVWNKGPGIANIRFENVRVENCRRAGVFAMPPERPLRIVTENCSFSFREPQSKGFDVWNAVFENRGLKTENLSGPFAVTAPSKETVPVPSTFPSWTDNDLVARRMLGLAPKAASGGRSQTAFRVASVFGHDMVLQRGRRIPVWGRAHRGAEIRVECCGQTKTTAADGKGNWRVELDPLAASSVPCALAVTANPRLAAPGSRIAFTNVVVGEVWLASGQSNMELPVWHEHPLKRELDGGLTLALAEDDLLRFANVSNYQTAKAPTNEIDVVWHATSAETLKAARFSAVAYHYARTLRDRLKVPVGIVGVWWGGSSIRRWVPGGDAWNRQVAPLAPFAARGLIWYQGEADVGGKSSREYDGWMRKLYDGWSRAFENPSMSLYFVQIPPFNYYSDHEALLELQRAQCRFADSEVNAAMTVITDVADPTHIHPLEKEAVGRRLALHALRRDYGFVLEDESPRLRAWKIEGDRFVLTFDHLKEAHVYYRTGMWQADGPREPDFEIAGEDGVWHPADVVNRRLETVSKSGTEFYEGRFADGNVLKVRSAVVSRPKKLRYLHSREGKRVFSNEMNLPCGAFEIE